MLVLACAGVFINTLFKGGTLNVMKVIGLLMVISGAIAAYQLQSTASPFKGFKSSFLKHYKYVDKYDQIGRLLFQLEFLRRYNNEDYTTLVQDVDQLLAMFNAAMSEEFGKTSIEKFIDKRKSIVNSLHSHVHSVPAEYIHTLGATATRLQALTYAMVKKIQRVQNKHVYNIPAPFDATNDGFM